jgi:hypothetical protein
MKKQQPKMMPLMKIPSGGAAAKALAFVNTFAHHAPSIEREVPRMQRPTGGKGPRNAPG